LPGLQRFGRCIRRTAKVPRTENPNLILLTHAKRSARSSHFRTRKHAARLFLFRPRDGEIARCEHAGGNQLQQQIAASKTTEHGVLLLRVRRELRKRGCNSVATTQRLPFQLTAVQEV
jgi:hypothetical protein